MKQTQNQHYSWARLRQMALEHKRLLILANIIALFATLASVPIPLLLPMLVDEVLLDQAGAARATIDGLFPSEWHSPALYILALLALTLLLRLSALLLTVWQARHFTLISKEIIFRMRRDLLQRLPRVAMSEYETLGSGRVAAHFVTDMETVDHFVSNSVSKFLIAVLTILGTASILLWIHWQLALLILFFNPIVIYFTTVLGKKVKHLKKKENHAFELFQQALTETLDAIQQIRAANREQHYLQRLIQHAQQVKQHAGEFAWRSDTANRLSFVIFLFGFDLFRAGAMFMVLYSDLSLGEMFAVFGYLWFMMGPVQEVLNIQYAFYAAKAALTRINSLLELKQEAHYPALKNPFAAQQSVGLSLKKIRFAYGTHPEVLRGINLEIKAGEKIAFVGASGGGKSTLVQLLIGLYPAQGQIKFNGVPVEQIGWQRVREHVIAVLQNPALFNDTVRNNLTLGRNTDLAHIKQAVEIAQLSDTLAALPAGLETVIGQQGMRLSGGQRQRLAIARMILSNPQVVILDEATSALDSDTERRLHRAMSDFLKNRTTLIIAHRLSAVKQADRIYVFEDGLISAEGQHQHLLQQDGLYAKLYGEESGAKPT
ncbi:MAG: ABC transporter ATP-binding protein [Gammaproteobacteria bacterium]|nr:ABC transporter ATP-binding protein [Gammaproteobacteria bacterium]